MKIYNKIMSNFKAIVMVFTIVVIMLISVAGCGKSNKMTYSTMEKAIQDAQTLEIGAQIRAFIIKEGSDEDQKNAINNTLAQTVTTALAGIDLKNNEDIKTRIKTAYDTLKTAYPDNVSEETKVNEAFSLQRVSAINTAIAQLDLYLNQEGLEQFEIDLGNTKKEEIKVEYEKAKTDESINVYSYIETFTSEMTTIEASNGPIRWKKIKEDGFFKTIFNNFLIWPVAWVMQFLSFGNFYVFGILITTLLIRTLMWPVYSKTNDMSLKMQVMQPELTKLEEKYANRADPESQRAKQQEQFQLYKKYKVGLGGCFMPLLQFPVFIAVYRAIAQMPYTRFDYPNVPRSEVWAKSLNPNVFGVVDLFETRGELWSPQFWAIVALVILVTASQIIQQVLTDKRQKKMQNKSQENIPEYKRQAVAASQSQKTMKYMMYFMVVMMAVFVWQSPAGLGFYWLVGNIYSMGQMAISQKLSAKKLEKMKAKHAR